MANHQWTDAFTVVADPTLNYTHPLTQALTGVYISTVNTSDPLYSTAELNPTGANLGQVNRAAWWKLPAFSSNTLTPKAFARGDAGSGVELSVWLRNTSSGAWTFFDAKGSNDAGDTNATDATTPSSATDIYFRIAGRIDVSQNYRLYVDQIPPGNFTPVVEPDISYSSVTRTIITAPV